MSTDNGNRVHPTALVEPGVILGSGNVIGPFTQIFSNTVIGNDNFIGAGVVIGAYPEHLSVNHLHSSVSGKFQGVVVGSGVVIREYAQIHQGLTKPTRIGDGAFLMNQAYIAHDCEVGDEVVLASSVLLAGNVTIGIGANLGMGTKVHQGVSIGRLSMVGMGSVVTRTIPDYVKAYGVPAKIHGANEIGMKRAGMLESDIESAIEIASRY
jgi:UDP-N-acetylglucosamine acyltransferase